MKMNPVNIPIHEAGHVCVYAEFGLSIDGVEITDDGASADYVYQTLSPDKQLTMLVAGTVAEHEFGSAVGRFALISKQLNDPAYKTFQDNPAEDLGAAVQIADNPFLRHCNPPFLDSIIQAEREARSILKKWEGAARAIADVLTVSKKLYADEIKQLLNQHRPDGVAEIK
jgi:hypothetical protein